MMSSIEIMPNRGTEKRDATISHIKEMVSSTEKGQLNEDLRNAKIIILRKEYALYAVDMGSSTIVNLRDTDIDLSPFMRHEKGAISTSQRTHTEGQNTGTIQQNPASNILRPAGSGYHANREWEVGGFDNWDDIDDERRMKR
jgi:hypothetical protein